MTLLVCVALIMAVILVLSIRWVPAGECYVVLRGRTVRRVVGPGVTLVDPVRDHGTRFVLETQQVPLVVRTATRDDSELVVLLTLDLQITDPGGAARTAMDPVGTTARVAEEIAGGLLAELTVAQVSADPTERLQQLVAAVNLRSSLWGVVVHAVHVDEVDLRLVSPR